MHGFFALAERQYGVIARAQLRECGHLDGEQLEHVFEKARRLGLTSKHVLTRRFEELGGKGRKGSTALRDMLRVVDGRPKESALEVRLARLVRNNAIHPEAIVHVTWEDVTEHPRETIHRIRDVLARTT